MELVQICDVRLGRGGSKFAIRVDGEIGMIFLVGEKGDIPMVALGALL